MNSFLLTPDIEISCFQAKGADLVFEGQLELTIEDKKYLLESMISVLVGQANKLMRITD